MTDPRRAALARTLVEAGAQTWAQTRPRDPRDQMTRGGKLRHVNSRAPRPGARQALGRARRRGRDAARPRRGGRRRLRRRRHRDTRHHPCGRGRLEGGARVPSRGEPRRSALGLDFRGDQSLPVFARGPADERKRPRTRVAPAWPGVDTQAAAGPPGPTPSGGGGRSGRGGRRCRALTAAGARTPCPVPEERSRGARRRGPPAS